MFSPPPGYRDLLADAERNPGDRPIARLEVPKVGAVRARYPSPSAVATLAMSANPSLSAHERTNYLVRFVSEHLESDSLESTYFGMMVGALPTNSIERVARSLATWETARPYAAVVTLAVMTGHHWRTMRYKFLSAGIPDPMLLPSMHALLDFTEAAVAENYANSPDAERDIATLNRMLYGPSAEANSLNDETVVPYGFQPEQVEDAFDAFARAAR